MVLFKQTKDNKTIALIRISKHHNKIDNLDVSINCCKLFFSVCYNRVFELCAVQSNCGAVSPCAHIVSFFQPFFLAIILLSNRCRRRRRRCCKLKKKYSSTGNTVASCLVDTTRFFSTDLIGVNV